MAAKMKMRKGTARSGRSDWAIDPAPKPARVSIGGVEFEITPAGQRLLIQAVERCYRGILHWRTEIAAPAWVGRRLLRAKPEDKDE